MKMEGPKISVITVVYNDYSHIEQTLKSVVYQNYDNIEYIVIDGKSTDGTVNIIQKFMNYITVFISEPDKGIYDAMNKGLSKTTGEYVIFMNSGDIFANSNVISTIFSNHKTSADVIYGKTIGNYKGIKLIQELSPFFESSSYCSGMGICHQSIFVRTSYALNFKFDLNFKVCADHKMIYELYKVNANFEEYKGVISEIICGEGYSDKHMIRKLTERGKIYGLNTTLKFKVFLYKSYIISKLRSLYRFFEPEKIRVYRFENKTNKI